MRQVYEKIYRNKSFSFSINEKEYSYRVINVTFEYNNKLFNRLGAGLFVKFGYSYDDIEIKDCVCIKNGELIAIQTYNPPKSKKVKNKDWEKKCHIDMPVSDDILGKYFYYDNGFYKARNNIKTLNTVSEIRESLYKNGFICNDIKYVRYKRSAGGSRNGKCLFIDERLYKKMHQWEMCGINIKKGQNVDLSALEPYIALTLSSIIDTVEIKSENILVIEDYESIFRDKTLATKLINGNLVSEPEEVEIKNNIWDGQSLLDVNVFGKYKKYGMLLLRNRFFKSCCFNTNIQQWFSDNAITDISQLNGYTKAKNIEDIKLITTPSSIKYLKFGSLNDWLWTLESTFGIVKHDKPTYYFDGRMVQCHYQLLNTIQLTFEEVEELVSPSFDYLYKLKTNPAVLCNHIKYPENFNKDFYLDKPLVSKNDIVYKLLTLNDKFSKTELYYKFQGDLVKSFIKNLRKGHLLIRGNYSTLFGNPLEMLKSTIGIFDGFSSIHKGELHCSNFLDGEMLLGSRSPHVATGNILIAKNKIINDINKYFNLTNEIVCVNSIEDNLLERLSGCDFDSDSMLLTNCKILLNGALRNYYNFLVPTKLVKSTTINRKYTPYDLADLDMKTGVNKIGEIINLSQELNSKKWDKINNGVNIGDLQEIYNDISQLDIMSNLEIDSAKRENPANNIMELKKIKEKYETRDEKGRYIRPEFFKYIDKDKGFFDPEGKAYKPHKTTMDYLQKHINKFRLPKTNKKDFYKFVDILRPCNEGLVSYKQVQEIINMVRGLRADIVNCFDSNENKQQKYLRALELKVACIEKLGNMDIGMKTMYYLLKLIECEKYKDVSRLLFHMLFAAPNKSFFNLIEESKEPIGKLIESENGEIMLYEFFYNLSL